MHEKKNIFSNIICLICIALLLVGCASKAPAKEGTVPGLVTEQTGDIQVIMPDELGEPTRVEAKPYTSEEKAAYLKIEAEFICESMTKDYGEHQKLGDIAKKYGMTEERLNEITNQLDKAAAYKEVGTEAAKLCPEAFAPSIG